MKHTILTLPLLCLLLVGLTNCSDSKVAMPDAAGAMDFPQLLAEYHETTLRLNPLIATYAGDNRYNDQLPNVLDQSYQDSVKAFYQHYLDTLTTIDRASLVGEEQTSYDILKWECETKLEAMAFKTDLTPVNQFESLHLTIGQLAGGSSAQPFVTVQDYDNWLSRLNGFLDWTASAKAKMEQGVKEGYVLPKALTEKMIPQLAAIGAEPVEQHLFYQPIVNLPADFTPEDKERLTTAYRDIIGKRIIPAYTDFAAYVANEYLAASRTTAGISEVPNGKAYYDHQIKVYTTTNMSADEIFALGESEVARLSTEMEKVKEQVGFKGELKDFFDYVRTLPELSPFDQPEQVIANFEAIHQKMQPQLEQLFDLKPKTAFEVRRTEAFREATASAEYMPGSVDGTRPGIFYVPIPDVENYNIFSDEDLFLHEAIPGHHYQISLTQENEDLPDFRRTLWYSAYGEGWALYCESLGKELGLYQDPYQYFGMLSAEMHRAIRLVVDAGMHVKGWTREEAIQYSLDHEAESEASIIAEIERYMSWPGQALSYKVGQLKIRELRARAEAKMGDRFDIKAFHNKVLESGCVPLAVLESKIDAWIAGG